MSATNSYICHYRSWPGCLILASDGEALTGLWFDRQAHFPNTLPNIYSESVSATCDLPVFQETFRWLRAYYAGRDPDFTPAIRLAGTMFQKRVWEAVREIPYGKTISYGEIAQHLSSSARAVGQAVANNPILLITPCHRVIGSDGLFHGFAGGLDRQAQLLALERAR